MTGRDRIVIVVLATLAVVAAAWLLVDRPRARKGVEARRRSQHRAVRSCPPPKAR